MNEDDINLEEKQYIEKGFNYRRWIPLIVVGCIFLLQLFFGINYSPFFINNFTLYINPLIFVVQIISGVILYRIDPNINMYVLGFLLIIIGDLLLLICIQFLFFLKGKSKLWFYLFLIFFLLIIFFSWGLLMGMVNL
jgi:hypothetical protein